MSAILWQVREETRGKILFMAVSKYVILCAVLLLQFCNCQEDEQCVQDNGEKGICISIHGCDYAIKLLKDRISPKVCGFKNDVSLVCCPTYGIKSKKKCGEYRHFPYDREGPIYVAAAAGGENALAEEFQHMAALGYGEENDIQWNCGGSLISENFVLTAAHCLYSKEYGFVKWVRLGDLNLQTTDDKAQPQNFKVESYIKHPEYKPPVRYNDIALIKLNRSVKISPYIIPGCLDTRTNLSNVNPVATGWGQLSFGGNASPHLQKVRLELFTIEECRKTYEDTSKRILPNGVLEESQICAGSYTDNKDTCPGDSGGPLQVQHEKFVFKPFSIIGITSFGKGCGNPNIPAVYTRVSHYIPWIEEIVWSQ